MTLGEVLERVRVEILDDVSIETAPDDNLWSDKELTAHANWSIREACTRSKLLFDKETVDVAVHTLGIGEFSKVIPPIVLFTERAWFDDKALAVTDEDQLERCYGSSWENRTGVPQAYYFVNNTIALFPKPESGGELKTRVCRLPLTNLAQPSDLLEINEQYHDALLHGIASKAYMKQDSQCLDTKAAVDQMLLFELVFGKPVSAKTVQHQRKRVQKRTQFRTF